MAGRTTDALADSMLAALKTALDGGTLYLFAGNVPIAAEDPLEPGSFLVLSINVAGTGLVFDAASGSILAKPSAASWGGTVVASGTPTFFRLCASGDNGEAAAAAGAFRLQGSVGEPLTSPDLQFDNTDFVFAETKVLDSFAITAGAN